MKAPKYAYFFVLIFLVSVFTNRDISAQWKVVAANLINPYIGFYGNPERGAIHFKDGVLWVGWFKDRSPKPALMFSNDTGKTWQQTTINLSSGDVNDSLITDINFYDKFNGLVATLNGGIFLTRDGGQSWKRILRLKACTSVAFNGSPNIIHVLTAGDVPAPTGLLHTSMDGGVTWSTSWPGGDFAETFTISKDRIIYVLCSADNLAGLPGFVSASTDFGKTWVQSPTEVDGDSYTICADSCDAKRLYVANEDYTHSVNELSDLYFSTDAGNSWVSAVAFSRPYLCGGMTCTANTIYSSSLENGIYRSIDQGLSWKNIGGPVRPNASMAFDSRNIACVNDNIVFLLDDQGSIWETTNSGGDSLAITPGFTDLLLSQNTLFLKDSLIVCDTSTTVFLNIKPIGCQPPTISKVELLGNDSLSYSSIPFAGDSIGVTFKPIFDNLNDAQLLLTLSDGRQKIVTLSGYGIPRAPLTLVTQDQKVDTLGGSIIVPITLNGMHKPEDVTLVVHYDTVLNYGGSFSPSGVKLDISGEQWKGRSKLLISNAIQNTTLGYSHFDVFNDSVPSQHITFDSVTVLSAINQCQYISPALAMSTVTPLSGCGVISISRFLHHGEMPQFALTPNPTSGDASITSTVSLGDAEIIVFDMLGTQRSKSIISLTKNTPARVALPLSNGVYSVQIKSGAGTYDLRIVVNR